ncbi:uncharacterized protein MELLADRAFT_123753 [Melampsora larici-populina 98AG31]|uniref:Secreted protein n=1 Tax=Melampsora larici-populina (strain 98AG31 / pathotype 3-4-7) TaxID=747676 RepID=F4R3M4_MELLP|nr:uncharacterized protein MELLADRAFT_123753 [Melampsora larici-populina 98AG31]EGG13144.1 secreted protein [Melampsora larici-populina 98AG31]
MLHIFLKISLLLFSLWIHGIKANSWSCNEALTTTRDAAVCKIRNGNAVKSYSCSYKSCWSDNHQYIELGNCRRYKTEGFSIQQCAQYEHQGDDVYKCTNPGGLVYHCLYHPQEWVIPMDCSKCQPIP